ncbi:MAG: hypothetical protein AAGG01_02175 [Planctomycetota bacterium]
MRSTQTTSPSPRRTLRSAPGAAVCLLLAVASCHAHDDDDAIATGSNLPPAGSSGAFVFSGAEGTVQRGEFFDCTAVFPDGSSAAIETWSILNRPTANAGGSLANVGASDSVRFISGTPGFYAIQAVDFDGRTGTYGFNVSSDAADLMVVEVIDGMDVDPVAASLATTGVEDLFIADRIGGSAAPQFLARANRAGDRVESRELTFKVQDMAADDAGNVTVIRTESTLTAALVRYDRDLNEDTTFSAPDLGTGAWREVVAMTRGGETLVPVDLNGGSLLRLGTTGAPAAGTLEQSLISLGLPFADVVDVATDVDGAAYVASATQIARIDTTGAVDTVFWSPEDQVAIRGIAADGDGVLFVALQDADGGQCGSIRKLDWTGSEFRRITEFSTGSEFAARKILMPVALGVFSDGSWRLYDDIVTLNPQFQRAAWILAGDLQTIE